MARVCDAFDAVTAHVGSIGTSPPWQDREVEPDEVPAIRAGWSARVLRAVGGLAPEVRDAVLDGFGNELADEIRAQAAMSWVPMRDHVALLEALVGEVGRDDARQLLRDASLRNLRSSLLAASVSATLRVFGVGPLALMRMFARGFRLITRNCGEVTVRSARDTPGTEVEFTELPEEVRREAWAVSMTAVFEAIMDTGKVSGIVRPDTTDLRQGTLRIFLRADNRDELVHDVDDR
jgi:hypothetical protein